MVDKVARNPDRPRTFIGDPMGFDKIRRWHSLHSAFEHRAFRGQEFDPIIVCQQ
jgi:hypothetical protein